MREILFRGKRVDNGEWVCGSLINKIDCGSPVIVQTPYLEDNGELEFDYYHVYTETVCQYTELKDKNGTKIFEGDMVHCTAKFDEADCIVIYDDGEFKLVLAERHKDYSTLGGYYSIGCFEKEIIGNIYDNTELLKGSD